jgi:hypothetical protein
MEDTGRGMEAGILGAQEHFGVLALTLVGISFDLMLKVACLAGFFADIDL